ncbi:MAG: fumarate hydratase, class II [Halobacteriovoraceae bacterium]|nr:fumarate hydratase, class II [Halobacteriovoraceae bacterium]|tara:strand:+ start:73382 stop:74764 length:1383 start_codon:yes stop_codon:yes gene_type:complete
MHRIEKDSMGELKISQEKYWGAQTQRSLENFPISNETFPSEFIHNYAHLKKACAKANESLGRLDSKKSQAIGDACDEIIDGKFDEHFPLKVWQTGSGTQTNMNVNEVVANRATELLGGKLGQKLVHPNDDVNMGQSSNDTFPTVMQISAALKCRLSLIPSLKSFERSLSLKAEEFSKEHKIGRTHLMDAVPMTVGQEFSAWASQVDQAREGLEKLVPWCEELPIGGTAIGTGLNTSKSFSELVVEELNEYLGADFRSCPNKFSKIASHDDLLGLSGALKVCASTLMKIANDIRLLGSGPRCGLAELLLPENEPGSSIMPGKVNPTQCEAMTMACAQVIGNDVAVSFGGMHGQLQLNAYKPLIIHNVLKSADLLNDAVSSFERRCLKGIRLNKLRLQQYRENSLMVVTAIAPKIGYEKASKIAHNAYENETSIWDEVKKEGLMSLEEYEAIVNFEKMANPR